MAADIGADESAQRKVGMIPLSRTGYNRATADDGLRTVERCVVHDRLEVAFCRDTESGLSIFPM